MNLFRKDYTKLYHLQDKFLNWWSTQNLPFYLTGGTVLDRFYINHRYSEDLDFFVNADSLYGNYIAKVKGNIGKTFSVNIQQALFTEDFTRLFITENDVHLKVEFVNDVDFRVGNPVHFPFGLIDTPANILANKLTAVIGRDEPKDVFDIVFIAFNYSFNWRDVFNNAKLKSVINEIDVEQRLYQFPVECMENIDWLNRNMDFVFFRNTLLQIADDFLLGKDNSVCKTKMLLEKAVPKFN